jgi:hypothetical protein
MEQMPTPDLAVPYAAPKHVKTMADVQPMAPKNGYAILAMKLQVVDVGVDGGRLMGIGIHHPPSSGDRRGERRAYGIDGAVDGMLADEGEDGEVHANGEQQKGWRRAASMLISSFEASQSGQELYIPEISGHCAGFEGWRSWVSGVKVRLDGRRAAVEVVGEGGDRCVRVGGGWKTSAPLRCC